ncbi:MFS transporter [Candidatus Cryptobacteroides sp.]|uniref:MFS transporter n=1 Tax=Candidatus Cryptobacteroides sp. TaxID=2952915 RepID=UPI002A751AE5|nr:MFS transporter [Candidatus Cryptobacteroides sp.]
MTNWRWWLCSLLFVATTVNYLDRQVLSLTYEEFIKPEFHWTDANYGTITSFFSILYAVACLFAGKFVDWMGTKKGYLIAIGVWSLGACMHAGCGIATVLFTDGIESTAALKGIEAGSNIALAVSTTSVYLFLLCRGILALGESGNFPAAIKVTAEYFPKKDRAFATSIFNAGASVGALAAPLLIPPLAVKFGWEMSFIIIGALGFVWMFFWTFMYDKPENSKHVNQAELDYIHQDDELEASEKAAIASEKAIPFLTCFKYRQTWSFIVGKFLTDSVWWFFLFWAPSYFSNQFDAPATSGLGQALIFTLYLIVTVLSIFGGYLPKLFVERKGMNPYSGRMLSMLIFAFFPIAALLAQPLGMSTNSPWWPAVLIGLAGAGHQAWSANLFSTIGDMFPKSTIATITGIGAMAGGLGSMIIQKVAGNLFTFAENAGASFSFLGFEGKPAGYFIMFCFCGIAYLVAWAFMKILVPRYKAIEY